MANLAKMIFSQKNLQNLLDSQKKKGRFTSLLWMLLPCVLSECCITLQWIPYSMRHWMFWLEKHLLVKQGIHKNPKKINLNFGKDRQVPNPKRIILWKKCCTVWHPVNYRDIYHMNWCSISFHQQCKSHIFDYN